MQEKALPRVVAGGRYVVEGELGRGGMGVVYLAHDTRLGRDVALKVLREAGARIHREARVLASLNHPGISIIHGIEETEEGATLVVLERVEGRSLLELLQAGPLPTAEALRVAAQIADALDAAHERGVVHRDLKPSNVMVTPRGAVKLLDFGVALVSGDEPAAEEPVTQRSPEGAYGSPDAGVGLRSGTPGYMSPEQARGEAQDRRVDVYAFGCVLFECLTGTRAFPRAGEAAAKRPRPPLERLPADLPDDIRRLLLQCLQEDPALRLADLGQARRVITSALEADRPAAPRRWRSARRRPRTRFVGRERETTQCEQLLGRTRLLTLSGVGGSGKTRLAQHLADGRVLSCFLDLTATRDDEPLDEVLLRALGLEAPGAGSLLAPIAEELAGKAVLLVLDNCEHLLAPCRELVEDLLEACPDLVVLATSREPLGVAGEHVYPLLPLEVPEQAAAAAAVNACPSVQLFVDRAAAIDPSFELTDERAHLVAEICRRVDGIPLAIELAAARLRVLGLTQLHARLEERFRLLEAGRDAPSRQRTLRGAIQWSVDALDPDDARLFRALSIGVGGVALDAARALVGGGDELALLDALTRLAERALLLVERGEGGDARYGMLETVRELAADELARAGEVELVRGRHLAFLTELAEAAQREPELPGRTRAYRRLDRERGNFADVLSHTSSPEARRQALLLTGALGPYWARTGRMVEGLAALTKALAATGPDDPGRARALQALGGAHAFRDDLDAATPCLEEALAVARRDGDRKTEAAALNSLGVVADRRSDYARAKHLYEQALDLARAEGEQTRVVGCLNNLGDVAWAMGDLEEALRYQEQAIEAGRRVGGLAPAQAAAALVLVRLGRGEEAGSRLVDALELARAEMARRHAADAVEATACLAAELEDPEAAALFYGAAVALREAVGVPAEPYYREHHTAVAEATREVLGEASFARAETAGRALSFEQAVGEALEWLGPVSRAWRSLRAGQL